MGNGWGTGWPRVSCEAGGAGVPAPRPGVLLLPRLRRMLSVRGDRWGVLAPAQPNAISTGGARLCIAGRLQMPIQSLVSSSSGGRVCETHLGWIPSLWPGVRVAALQPQALQPHSPARAPGPLPW